MTTQNDLKRMSRLDIIELMVQQGREIEQLKTVIADQEARLADRTLKVEKCGTMAEAALSVNGVLEAAQQAAEQYLENIKEMSGAQEEICEKRTREVEAACAAKEEDTLARCASMLKVTQQRCDNMRELTEADCSRLRAEADAYYAERKSEADAYFNERTNNIDEQVEQKWAVLSERLEKFYQSHVGLKELLEKTVINQKDE